MSEMEVTGQAFEDMQEQNIRLLQQLREKDDANFKLMSEVSQLQAKVLRSVSFKLMCEVSKLQGHVRSQSTSN